jgi:hypothetical protein
MTAKQALKQLKTKGKLILDRQDVHAFAHEINDLMDRMGWDLWVDDHKFFLLGKVELIVDIKPALYGPKWAFSGQ